MRRSRRRGARTAALPIAVLTAIGLLTACGGDAPAADESDTATLEVEPTAELETPSPQEEETTTSPKPSPSPSVEASPTSQVLASDASGWLAGNLVTLTESEYDAETGYVTVTALVENTATSESFGGRTGSWILLDVGPSAPVAASSVSSVVPLGSTVEVELEFWVEEAPVLEDAVLQLGPAGTRQWTVPLAPGAQGEGIAPVDYPVTGVLDVAGMSFTVTSAQLVPWTCYDSDDYGAGRTGRITYEPVADDKMGLVVWGDFVEAVSYTGGNGITAMSIIQPSGVTANAIGAIWHVFAAADRVEDYGMCFTVDEPGTGAFQLGFTTYRSDLAPLLPITIG